MDEKSQSDLKDNPIARWDREFSSAKSEVEKWHKDAKDAIKAFLCDGKEEDTGDAYLPLFTANVTNLMALLYGRVPHADVSRRFGDASDDLGRVGAEMLERHLNADIESDADGGAMAFRHSLEDRLLAGMGNARALYVVEMEPVKEGAVAKEAIPGPPGPDGQPTELAPAVPAVPKKSYECVETVYSHWQDQLWSPARTFGEVRWWAFRNPMTREEQVKRFGTVGRETPLNSKKAGRTDADSLSKNEPWDKTDVWEIWDKEQKKVCWYVEGFSKLLEEKEDTYELEGFWPFPRPLWGLMTTSKLVPVTDYKTARPLYRKASNLFARISMLEEAVAVKGAYNAALGDALDDLVSSRQNKLIPVRNWAMFGEGGGIRGNIDWYPLDTVVAAIDKLTAKLQDTMALIFQVTGQSDIMRGQAMDSGATATEQGIKAKFASVRVQALQDDFARFVSDFQRIKAEIICKHFDAQTIIERSNIMSTPDAQLAPQAAEFLKSKFETYRVEVKPEAVSMTDFASLKAERMEVLTGLGAFFQSMMPAIQLMPQATGMVLELAQWTVAGLKGASGMEGIFDRAIDQAKQAMQQQAMQPPQQQQPDPKLQIAQAKTQGDIAKIQAQAQSEVVRIDKETQALAQRRQTDAAINIQEEAAKARIKAGGGAPLMPPGQGVPV